MRIITSCLLFIVMSVTAVHAAPRAEEGKLDLSAVELASADPVELSGSWLFHEGVFLAPEQLGSHAPVVIQAPATWGSQPLGMGNHGYGTYHLMITLSEADVGKPLGFHLPCIASAYDLYINGVKAASAGEIGISRSGMAPAARPQTLYWTPESRQLELVVHVSNFSQRKGGMWDALRLGTAERMAQEREQRLMFQMFIAAGLLLLGIFHVGFYAIRADKSTLYFGLACLLLFLRNVYVGEMIAAQWLPGIPWELAVKIEYVSVFWGVSFLVLYFCHLYRDNLNRAVSYGLALLMIGITLPVLVLPAIVYTEWMVVYQFTVLILILHILYGLLRAALHRRMGAKINLAAGLIFLATAMNDILHYNFLFRSIDLVTLGLFIFIFTQMFMLANKFAFAFREAERLKDKLEAVNVNLEQMVEQRTEALRSSNEQLRKSEQARSSLLSDITHEIGNPLTSVIGYLRRLTEGVADNMQARHIEIAYRKALKLERVTEDLRQLAHLEQEQFSYDRRYVALSALYDALQKAYDWELLEREVAIRWQTIDAQRVGVCVDLHRIEQVFANFVNNALVHTAPQDPITITGRYYAYANACVIAVQDAGGGIAPSDRKQIFNRFYRVKPAGAEHGDGSGLGLTIAEAIIEAHGGKIGVRSAPGRGSTFYFILPTVEGDA